MSSSLLALPLGASLIKSTKIGIMDNLFRLNGYESGKKSNLVKYSDSDEARKDLASGKIEFLITSPIFLTKDAPQFNVFSSVPMDLSHDKKVAWVSENYSAVAAYHAGKGFSSEFIGALSPLMVRMTHFEKSDIADWNKMSKKIRIAANGARAIWLDHIGFDVIQNKDIDRLDYQIKSINRNELDITDAHSPALFIKSILHNQKLNIIPESFYSRVNLIVDLNSKGSLPIELLRRNGSSDAEYNSVKTELKNLIQNDYAYQEQALGKLVEAFQFPVVQGLPESLCNELIKCKNTHFEVLSRQVPQARELIAKYRGLS